MSLTFGRCHRLLLSRILSLSSRSPPKLQSYEACFARCHRDFATGRENPKDKKVPITWKSLGITFAIGGSPVGRHDVHKKEEAAR
ncbi:hypothetical protein MTO96_012750 [Rhipicephalus appendiculatus]